MIHFIILKEVEIILVVFKDLPSLEEVDNFREELISHPDYTDKFDAIVDMSKLTKNYSAQDISTIAKRDSQIKNRIATIAPSDETYGNSRMWEMMTESKRLSEANVFRDIDSAITWLKRTQQKEQIYSELKKLYDTDV